MSWKTEFAFGLAALLGGGAYAQAQSPSTLPPPLAKQLNQSTSVTYYSPGTATIIDGQPVQIVQTPGVGAGAGGSAAPTAAIPMETVAEAPAAPESLGPTPLGQVGILQHLIYGDNADNAKIKFSGWMDFDYTFRSTGPGQK